MPKATAPQEFTQLVELISHHQEGIGLDEIAQALQPVIARRTLQRRWALLVAQGRIIPKGVARATKYHLPTTNAAIATAAESNSVHALTKKAPDASFRGFFTCSRFRHF